MGLWECLNDAGVFCGVERGEGSGDAPVLEEEEEGRRWLSRMETLDSLLCDRLETEEAPGFWRESREDDRPSPNRGNNGKRRERESVKEEEKGMEQKGKPHEVGVHCRDGIWMRQLEQVGSKNMAEM